MKTAAILAEYNPFHNGHKRQIEATRAAGATHIVALMSGSLVQRGAFAVFSKQTRAQAALLCGADLVLELPCTVSLASAQRFAEGGVSLLGRLGVIDLLSFGSESGDPHALAALADTLCRPDCAERLHTLLKQGVAYPTAKQRAAAELDPNGAKLLQSPNDLLAVEYLCACKRLGVSLTPLAIPRAGATHDSAQPADGFASASYLRSQIESGASVAPFVPPEVRALYQAAEAAGDYRIHPLKYETAGLYALKSLSKAEFEHLPDVSEGLHNRLYAAARQAETLAGFYDLAKTKRYTHARLRRISLYALMRMQKADLAIPPAYLRVLAANARGKELLAAARARAALPCITAFSKAQRLNARLAELDSRATDLHTFLSRAPRPAGQDFLNGAILLDEPAQI